MWKPTTQREIAAYEFYQKKKDKINQIIIDTVEESTIIKWFSNFENCEHEDMLIIMNGISVYNENKVQEFIKKCDESLKYHFKGNLDKVYFTVSEPSLAASGARFIYDIVKECGVSKNMAQSLENIPLNDCKGIVFVDDCIGTGNQMYEFIGNYNIQPDIKKICFAFLAFKEGIDYLRNAVSANGNSLFAENGINCGEILTTCDQVFASDSRLLQDNPAKERINNICLKYGKALFEKHPLGYKDSQLLITFENQTPNNTLPIIWAGPRTGKSFWNPLFKRIEPNRDSSVSSETLMRMASSMDAFNAFCEYSQKETKLKEIEVTLINIDYCTTSIKYKANHVDFEFRFHRRVNWGGTRVFLLEEYINDVREITSAKIIKLQNTKIIILEPHLLSAKKIHREISYIEFFQELYAKAINKIREQ